MKKIYIKPLLNVIKLKYNHHLMVGTIVDTTTTYGLDDNEELEKDDEDKDPWDDAV